MYLVETGTCTNGKPHRFHWLSIAIEVFKVGKLKICDFGFFFCFEFCETWKLTKKKIFLYFAWKTCLKIWTLNRTPLCRNTKCIRYDDSALCRGHMPSVSSSSSSPENRFQLVVWLGRTTFPGIQKRRKCSQAGSAKNNCNRECNQEKCFLFIESIKNPSQAVPNPCQVDPGPDNCPFQLVWAGSCFSRRVRWHFWPKTVGDGTGQDTATDSPPLRGAFLGDGSGMSVGFFVFSFT